jgi:hypothetical protein
MYITGALYLSGSAGIGTNSPVSSLHLNEVSTSLTLSKTVSALSSSVGAIEWRNNHASTGVVWAKIDAVTLGTGANPWDFSNITFSTWNGFNSLTERMRITNTGNVGIGTASPSTRLDVRTDTGVLIRGATSNSDAILSFLPTTGGRQYDFRNFGSNFAIVDSSANVTRMYFNFNGNTGIGLTDPSALLHISGSGSGSLMRISSHVSSSIFFVSGSGNIGIGVTDLGPDGLSLATTSNYSWSEGSGNAYATLFRQRNSAATVMASGYKRSNTGNFASSYGISMARAAIAVGSNNGSIAFFSDPASNIANGTDIAPSERMTILNSGNVGIGTSNPTTPLHISSSASQMVRITTNGALSTGFYDAFQMLAANQTGGGLSLNVGKAESNNNLAKMVYFHSSDGSTSNRLGFGFYGADGLVNILASGNVGIGNTNARTRLQVTPTSNAETPVLGTANGIATFTSANTNYGLQLNSTSDGTFFMQSQRFDASATAYALGLNPVGGYVYLGKGWGASNHRINLEVAQGNNILVVSGYSGASNDSVIIKAAAGANPNATTTVMEVTTNSSTGRSISAGGTINASGTDYAEYIEKAVTDTIAKGDIIGINSDAKLTNIFADAISFVVKSTDPSYVGGDAWGNIVGKRPERTTDQTEEEFAPKLAEFEARLETARAKVDRIAFSGQVPCNVTGAAVGDYIIPVQLENGKIGGQAITNPTFEQYQISVGKVWKIMEDGRAWIAVKIG